MNGAEFLTKESNHKDVFTYEDFTEEEVMMYKATKDFIQQEILTNMQKIEKQEGTIVKDILQKAGEIGLLGVSVPQELGGLGMNFNTSMLIALAQPMVNLLVLELCQFSIMALQSKKKSIFLA